jgi:ArsR family transcriptional regulator
MAAHFRLLGDGTRLAVIRALLSGRELNVSRLVAETGRTQSNVSKHLKRLTRAGLLGRRKDGLEVYYRLADPMVEPLCRMMCDAVKLNGRKKR